MLNYMEFYAAISWHRSYSQPSTRFFHIPRFCWSAEHTEIVTVKAIYESVKCVISETRSGEDILYICTYIYVQIHTVFDIVFLEVEYHALVFPEL